MNESHARLMAYIVYKVLREKVKDFNILFLRTDWRWSIFYLKELGLFTESVSEHYTIEDCIEISSERAKKECVPLKWEKIQNFIEPKEPKEEILERICGACSVYGQSCIGDKPKEYLQSLTTSLFTRQPNILLKFGEVHIEKSSTNNQAWLLNISYSPTEQQIKNPEQD